MQLTRTNPTLTLKTILQKIKQSRSWTVTTLGTAWKTSTTACCSLETTKLQRKIGFPLVNTGTTLLLTMTWIVINSRPSSSSWNGSLLSGSLEVTPCRFPSGTFYTATKLTSIPRSIQVACCQAISLSILKWPPFSIFGWVQLQVDALPSSKVKGKFKKVKLSLTKTLNSGPKTLVLLEKLITTELTFGLLNKYGQVQIGNQSVGTTKRSEKLNSTTQMMVIMVYAVSSSLLKTR